MFGVCGCTPLDTPGHPDTLNECIPRNVSSGYGCLGCCYIPIYQSAIIVRLDSSLMLYLVHSTQFVLGEFVQTFVILSSCVCWRGSEPRLLKAFPRKAFIYRHLHSLKNRSVLSHYSLIFVRRHGNWEPYLPKPLCIPFQSDTLKSGGFGYLPEIIVFRKICHPMRNASLRKMPVFEDGSGTLRALPPRPER